jgi:hypothetical protein
MMSIAFFTSGNDKKIEKFLQTFLILKKEENFQILQNLQNLQNQNGNSNLNSNFSVVIFDNSSLIYNQFDEKIEFSTSEVGTLFNNIKKRFKITIKSYKKNEINLKFIKIDSNDKPVENLFFCENLQTERFLKQENSLKLEHSKLENNNNCDVYLRIIKSLATI